MATKKKAAREARDGRGRPERVRGGGSAAQFAVRLSAQEMRQLTAWAKRNGLTRTEVIRTALRNLGAISATAP
jgi:hypothetical protein